MNEIITFREKIENILFSRMNTNCDNPEIYLELQTIYYLVKKWDKELFNDDKVQYLKG